MRRSWLPFFLFGLGSQLQLWGVSLSFTELFTLVAAPVLFVSEYWHLKKNGLAFFFWLSIFLVISAALSCYVNHSPAHAVLRGMAVVCLMPCSIVVCHWLLRRNLGGFKWFLTGVAVSSVLCTFVFRRAVEVSMWAQGIGDSQTTAMIMSGPLFWVERLGSFALLLPKGWYLSCPLLVSACLPLALAGFALMTTVSGRSAALGAFGSFALVLLGGNTQASIKKRICKHMLQIGVCGVMLILLFYSVYRISATKGWLGEDARTKYLQQSKGGKGGIGALLLGGRMDSFCGLMACIDHPIVGAGPWPADRGGYVESFMRKYGNAEDLESFRGRQEHALQLGIEVNGIPCHSHVTMFWCWFGIGGLLFIAYIIFIQIRYLFQDCWAIPQWYFWLAASMPTFMWAIFFSPIAGRTGFVFVSVAVLVARAVRRGRLMLPHHMLQEIVKHGH